MLKRKILLSKAIAEADHVVRATLSNSAGTTVKGVVCGIFPPKRATDAIKMHFQPTPSQANRLNFALMAARPPELALKATLRHGNRRLIFSADRVWCTSISTGHRYDIPFVSDFTGTSDNLYIKHSGVDAPARRRGTFFLTPNPLINTAMLIVPSYDGNVRVHHVLRPRFSLRDGVRLTFTKHFNYRKVGRDESVSSSELVAEFRLTGNAFDVPSVSEDLDSFLLLTSFATRHRCVCLGWTYTDPRGNIVNYYRRNIAIPKDREISNHDTLIDMPEFPKFIRTSYRRFGKFSHKDQFNSAIYPLISDVDKTTEMSYFSLFSALEGALLFADQTFRLFPRGHQTLHTRWGLFKSRFNVDVSDLWPMTDGTRGITPTQLRNKGGYGEHLNPAQTLALLYARQHLRWILERVLLTLLGWPISKSKVGPALLGRQHAYREWAQARTAF